MYGGMYTNTFLRFNERIFNQSIYCLQICNIVDGCVGSMRCKYECGFFNCRAKRAIWPICL